MIMMNSDLQNILISEHMYMLRRVNIIKIECPIAHAVVIETYVCVSFESTT